MLLDNEFEYIFLDRFIEGESNKYGPLFLPQRYEQGLLLSVIASYTIPKRPFYMM